jgi:hypothetical protein
MATAKRWTHIRVPVELAERITRLAEATETAYAEGRIELPNAMAEHVPLWFVIANAIDEQEARRERSRRPRVRSTASTTLPPEPSPSTEIHPCSTDARS